VLKNLIFKFFFRDIAACWREDRQHFRKWFLDLLAARECANDFLAGFITFSLAYVLVHINDNFRPFLEMEYFDAPIQSL
jgi:hypothetical protein